MEPRGRALSGGAPTARATAARRGPRPASRWRARPHPRPRAGPSTSCAPAARRSRAWRSARCARPSRSRSSAPTSSAAPQALEDRERNLDAAGRGAEAAKRVQRKELERISGLTAAQAKQLLIADVEQEARHQAALTLRQIEEETKREAERRARNILSIAMQRLAAHARQRDDHAPGRAAERRDEGADHRPRGPQHPRARDADRGRHHHRRDAQRAVVLSSFDGVRREIARLTLERLIADGRIHPARSRRRYEKARAGGRGADRRGGRARRARGAGSTGSTRSCSSSSAGCASAPATGRTSSTTWSSARSWPAMIAAELGVSVETARRAALLHDIGKAVSHEVEGPHAQVGAQDRRAATARPRPSPTRSRRTTTRSSRAPSRP